MTAAWLLAATLLAALALWRRSRRLARFLDAIKAYSQKVASGDAGAALGDSPGGREGQAGLALQGMVLALTRALDEAGGGRRQLAKALESMGEGVLLLDPRGRLLWANPALERLVGAEQGSLEGRFYWDAFKDPRALAALKLALEGREQKCSLPSAQGEESGLLLRAAPFHEDAALAGAVALLQDRSAEARLERQRRDFVANVSHELRTPLAAIKAALETLRDGALEDPRVNRGFVDKALGQGERLHALIDDLLALGRIEEERRLERASPQARAVLEVSLRQALSSLEPSLHKHGGRVESDLPVGLPLLRIEPEQLRQILGNLLENGLKYAGPGPRLRVSAQAADAFIEVSVSDQGPGVPPESLPRLFERFYRVDKARSREAGGSGLGLAIVKHLAESQGGQAGVENLPQGGCRFWFRLEAAS